MDEKTTKRQIYCAHCHLAFALTEKIVWVGKVPYHPLHSKHHTTTSSVKIPRFTITTRGPRLGVI